MLLALQQCSQLRPRLLCSADAGTPRHGHPRRSRAKSAGRRHRAARVHEAHEARLQVANGRVALRVLRLCARHIPPARSTRRHVIDGYANAVRAASRLEDDDLGAGVLTSLEPPDREGRNERVERPLARYPSNAAGSATDALSVAEGFKPPAPPSSTPSSARDAGSVRGAESESVASRSATSPAEPWASRAEARSRRHTCDPLCREVGALHGVGRLHRESVAAGASVLRLEPQLPRLLAEQAALRDADSGARDGGDPLPDERVRHVGEVVELLGWRIRRPTRVASLLVD